MLYALIDYSTKHRMGKISSEEILGEVRVVTPKIRERNEKLIAKKLVKTLNCHKVENIVLSRDLAEKEEMLRTLEDAKKKIITGNRISKVLSMKFINDIAKYTGYSKEKMNVLVLLNEYSLENIDLIEYISKDVKEFNLISRNYTKYNKTALRLFEQYGYMINLHDENASVDFKRCNLIINFDFSDNMIKRLKLPKNCILMSLNNNLSSIKQNFKGIIINDIEIFHEELRENKRYRDLAVCEAKIYKPLRMIKDNERMFVSEKYVINGYFGNKGKITTEEFEKVGRNFM